MAMYSWVASAALLSQETTTTRATVDVIIENIQVEIAVEVRSCEKHCENPISGDGSHAVVSGSFHMTEVLDSRHEMPA
ncbi:hypothetical protein DAEQUDRAFT_725162 [Daedalea quercina L-15889]|uniref:Uncharacterized protein n=1 Tax=Daedalea quercina L-15889 TaxID=1314783 RepID=A0A165RDX4_9APHY|nr:hypothetical protein DAEQUDRAFT_725162 [Daedalea quercina L-15889]